MALDRSSVARVHSPLIPITTFYQDHRMDVSPHRPDQDGHRSVQGRESSRENASNLLVETPPTLFKLRDLKVHRVSSEDAATPQSAPSTETSSTSQHPTSTFSAKNPFSDLQEINGQHGRDAQNNSVPGGSAQSETVQGREGQRREVLASSEPSPPSPQRSNARGPHEPQPGPETQQPQVTDTPSPRRSDQTPSGRDWMESMVTRKNALAFLSVLAVLVLWNSQFRAKNSPIEQDDHDMIQGLPLAKSGVEMIRERLPQDSSAGPGTIASRTENPKISIRNQQPPTASLAEVEAMFATSTSPLSGTVSSQSSQLHAPFVDPQPKIGPSELERLVNGENTSHLGAFDTTVIQAVSSRSPVEPRIDPPSLEELELAAANADSSPLETEAPFYHSTTPRGVSDWLKFYPEIPGGTVR